MERATLLSNRAAAALELRDFEGAAGDCDAALAAVGGGVGVSASPDEKKIRDKVRYRRALAYLAQNKTTRAKIDHAAIAATTPWRDLEVRARELAKGAPRKPWPEMRSWVPPAPKKGSSKKKAATAAPPSCQRRCRSR